VEPLAAAEGVAPALEMHASRVLALEQVAGEVLVGRAGAEALEMRLAAGGQFGLGAFGAAVGAG